jgi:hypothetical protein
LLLSVGHNVKSREHQAISYEEASPPTDGPALLHHVDSRYGVSDNRLHCKVS